MALSTDVDDVLRSAGIPILGVSCPSDDKATWRVDFAPGATQAQKDQATSLIAAFSPLTPTQLLDKSAGMTSRQKDILATVALIVRQSNVSAWNAMTLAQKKTAVLAAADDWKSLRIFVENNT